MAELIDFEDTVTYKLGRVTTAYRNAIERHVGVIGLHSGQVFILIELWRQNGLRQVDLAERLALKAPTINRMIGSLKQINLVRSEREEGDARSSRIFLTQKGFDIRKQVDAQWVELEAEYLRGLNKNERHILSDLLEKLKAAYTGREYSEDEE